MVSFTLILWSFLFVSQNDNINKGRHGTVPWSTPQCLDIFSTTLAAHGRHVSFYLLGGTMTICQGQGTMICVSLLTEQSTKLRSETFKMLLFLRGQNFSFKQFLQEIALKHHKFTLKGLQEANKKMKKVQKKHEFSNLHVKL